jgi:hypothetical protein
MQRCEFLVVLLDWFESGALVENLDMIEYFVFFNDELLIKIYPAENDLKA